MEKWKGFSGKVMETKKDMVRVQYESNTGSNANWFKINDVTSQTREEGEKGEEGHNNINNNKNNNFSSSNNSSSNINNNSLGTLMHTTI